MKHILVYGDSLTWGIIPLTRRRLPFHERWPGIVESELNGAGGKVRIAEDCVNGRRTAWDDPLRPGRNGLVGIWERVEAQSPLDLMVVMLGTNDFQTAHQHDAATSAQGLAKVIQAMQTAPIEPGMAVAPILAVAPPPTLELPVNAEKFRDVARRSEGMTEAYRAVAIKLGCAFFDAGTVAQACKEDGVHLDAAAHRALGVALAPVIAKLLA